MTVDKLRNYEPFFGSWTVESKIAEGRHSKVFKVGKVLDGQAQYQCLKTIRFPADDHELSKVISSGIYQNVQQYLDEVELTVRNNMDKMLTLRNNENIVRFDNYSIIKESSCFYLVILMELLQPMSDYLKVDSVSQNDVIDLGCDICCALEGFREAGIIHHEVKPENIYVDSEGNFKLGDFGVCKGRFGEDKIVSSYIAPELYTNGAIDINSDIYSLGILLYKLLNNNRLPFLPSFPAPVSIEDRETAFTRRMRGDLFPAPSNATSPLANVIYKAAAFRVQERYADPAAFMQALEMHYIAPASTEETAVFVPPVPAEPIVPVNPYHITEEDGVPLYERSPVRLNDVTDEDKEDFAEVFSNDDEDEDDQEGETVNKKWYFIIVALVVILAFIIALIAKNGAFGGKNTTTSAAPDITFGQQTTGPTTTTEPTTIATTTATTTTATTTTATTTTATTTTTTTTATTTTATTTATTTTATTTTATTTTEAPTEPTTPAYVEPILVYSPNTEDGTDTQGRRYKPLTLSVEEGFGEGNEMILVVKGLQGENAETDESCITVCTMDNNRMVKRSPAVISVESQSKKVIRCKIIADDETFSFEPEKYQYFICLEDGAISTEDTVNLGTQIRIEE